MPPTHTDEGLRAAIRDPREPPRRRRARALAVRRARARDEAARRLGRGRRLPPQGPRSATSTSSSAPSGASASGGSAHRPDHRLDAARPRGATTTRSPSSRPREREVLELMAEGRSNQGIADRLVITLRAVEKYVSSIFTKLGLPSTGSDSRRVLAVLLYLRGLASGGHQKTAPSRGRCAVCPAGPRRDSLGSRQRTDPRRRDMKTKVIQNDPDGGAITGTPPPAAVPAPSPAGAASGGRAALTAAIGAGALAGGGALVAVHETQRDARGVLRRRDGERSTRPRGRWCPRTSTWATRAPAGCWPRAGSAACGWPRPGRATDPCSWASRAAADVNAYLAGVSARRSPTSTAAPAAATGRAARACPRHPPPGASGRSRPPGPGPRPSSGPSRRATGRPW